MTDRYSPSQVNDDDDDDDSDEFEMNQQPSMTNAKTTAETAAVATEDEKLDQVLDEQGGEEEYEHEGVEGPLPHPHDSTEYDEQIAACSDDNPAAAAAVVEMSVPPHMTTAEKCELCDVAHSSEEAANDHYQSSEHAEKANEYLKSVYSDTGTENKQKNGDADDEDDNSEIPAVQVEITDEFIQKYKYSCTYCGLCFQEFEHMFRHEKGPMHAIRVWEYQQGAGGYNSGSRPKRNRNSDWPDGFYCSICDVDVTSPERYQEHLKTEQHRTRAQRLMDTGTPNGNGEAEGGGGGGGGDGGQRGGYRGGGGGGGWRGGMMGRGGGGGGGPWRGPVPLNMMGPGYGPGPGPGPGGPWMMRGRGGPRFRPYDYGPRGGFRGGPRGFGGGPGGPGGPRGPFRPMGPMRGGRGGGGGGGGGPPPGPFNFFNSGGPQGGGGYQSQPQPQQQQQMPKHGYTMGTGGFASPASTPSNTYGAQPAASQTPTDDQSQQQAGTGPKQWWNL